MHDALLIDRLQFTFTVTFHYLFPQLTMGLSLLIVILLILGFHTNNELYHTSARFWGRILAINFVIGAVTGIPLEFQFGTNWSVFSKFSGNIVGQTLAMEGIFAFFLESTFLGIFIFGEKKFGKKIHFLAAILVCAGAWLSGYFIDATNAWMQHPVAFSISPGGTAQLTSLVDLLTNPWLFWQYIHTMLGAVVTAAFVMASVGSYYLLQEKAAEYGRVFVKIGVISGMIASVLLLFPSGDEQARNVAQYQPVSFAAMEGVFDSKPGAELILIGQPNMATQKLDNPITVPNLLSFLTYHSQYADVQGLNSFAKENWPGSIPLLYYCYHIMVGLGTIFIAILLLAMILLIRKKLFVSRKMLWILLLSFPFPYIANTAGWTTAELGRQPWIAYGLMRTSEGMSPLISEANGLFTLIGFIGIYLLLGMLFILLVLKHVARGPEGDIA